MLSIGFVSGSGARYYTEIAARTDYYIAGGESPGEWHKNKAADAFGLRGTVDKEELERFFDGYHPETGEALANNHGKADRRAAIDMCLSVPKDVSALWAVSGDKDRRQIEGAFDRAVDQTLRYVSENFGYTRRGQGGYEQEKIVDLLFAKFVHRQSRGQDPQLHAHCLLLNAAERADGGYGTIDAGPLLREKKLICTYLRSALASELKVPLEPDRETKFSFRVRGVPERLSEHWSSRGREIEAEAKARDVEGGRAKAYLTLETRRAKEERPLIEVNKGWRNTAREYGFTEHEVEKILREPRRALCPSPEREAKVIDAAVTQAVKNLTSQQAHFRRSDLIRDVCVATVTDGISPERIHKRVEAALQADHFIDLGRGGRFTTKEIFYEVEQKALEAAGRLGERAAHVVRDRTINKEIAREARLNEGQKAAIQTVCRGPDLTLIQGAPGTGKSTLLDVVRRAVETDGGNVIGITPSNRAARELEQNSGIKSYTVHRFLYEEERTVADTAKHHAKMVVRTAFGLPTWRQPKLDINRHTTLIIDECSMVDNDKLSRALAHAEKAGCRVVLVGDNRQLPAIQQGGLFRELYERARDDQKVALTDIVRQREAWAREAIHQVGRGDANAALKAYAEHGRLHVLPTRDETERGLIERWKERGLSDPRSNLILASTNAEVASLNGRAQKVRLEAGRLGLRSVEVGDERIHEGDRVLFTDTKKSLGLVKSEFGTVTHIDWLTDRLSVQVDGQGDRRPVTFSLRQFDALRLGYAATTHRAQGMTLDQNVYALMGGGMQNREMTYVQISRARGETHLFCDEKTVGRDRSELSRVVGRSEEKLSAHAVAREEARPIGWRGRREEGREQGQGAARQREEREHQRESPATQHEERERRRQSPAIQHEERERQRQTLELAL